MPSARYGRLEQSAVAFQDYAPRVLDCKIKVDKYLSAFAMAHTSCVLRSDSRCESTSWHRKHGMSFPRHGDVSMWKATEASLEPDRRSRHAPS